MEPSLTDEGNDDYGQVCGAETIVPALSSNEDILENTITTVESLPKDLCRGSSVENGLPLRHSPAKKKLKVTEVDYHKVKHKTLPKRRRHSKRRKDRGVVVDLTRDEGNSKDSAVELEEVGIIRCFLTTIERTVYVNV